MASKLAGHYRVEYACGHVHSQCRCIAPSKPLRRLDEPCSLCAPQWKREHPEGSELKSAEWWRAQADKFARIVATSFGDQDVRTAAVEVSAIAGREEAIERTRAQTRGYREAQ